MDTALLNLAHKEVVEFHVAVQRWFSGGAEDATFARIANALAPDFSMTTPDGRNIAEPLVSDWLRSAKGTRGPAFRIWIERLRPVVQEGGLIAVIYDECQHVDGKDTRRHATALFRQAPAAPGGVVWVRVHETWAG